MCIRDSMYSVLYSQAPPYNYSSLWYKPNGTDPLIIGNNPSTTVANFFDVRASYWPQEGTDGLSTAEAAAFPWMEWVFLPYSHNGIVSVSVAQHRNGRFCDAPLNSYTNLSLIHISYIECILSLSSSRLMAFIIV